MDAHTINLLGALAVGCADLQDEAMAAAGLPPADLAALLAVHTRPGSTVGEVAATTGLTHSGAVRVIDRLELAGHVERRAGDDRRTAAIVCTRRGHDKALRALALRRRALGDALSSLTASDRANLQRIAGTILAGLPTSRPDAWRICRLCEHGVCRGDDCPVGSAVP